jgi:hypothetical protein
MKKFIQYNIYINAESYQANKDDVILGINQTAIRADAVA